MNRFAFKCFSLILICSVIISSCTTEKIPEPYIDFEFAEKCYLRYSTLTSISDSLVFYNFIEGEFKAPEVKGEIKQSDLISMGKEYDYYDIKISDKKNVSLRLFFLKQEQQPLINSIFIYDSLYNTSVTFDVGGNALDIDKEFQPIYHRSFPDDPDYYFFDILNQAGCYRYHCIDNIITEVHLLDQDDCYIDYSPLK